MVVTMQARLSQQAMRQGKTISNELFVDSSNVDFFDTNSNNIENDYRWVSPKLSFFSNFFVQQV